MNQLLTFQTQKKSPLSIKIWWYLMTSCFRNKTSGSHSNWDCLYLSQNYFKLPHQKIRKNANFFCLFPQDQKNIGHIFNHVSQDMMKEQFNKLCKTAWSKPHNFVVIDLTLPKNCGKYRSRFDDFYNIKKWPTLNFFKNWEKYFSENFNSDCGFREFDKNIDDFYPTTRVGSNAKVWDGFGEFRDVLCISKHWFK